MGLPYFPIYGVGFVCLTPSGSNVTPVRLFQIGDASVSQKIELEDLPGDEMDPIDVAPKSRTTTIKCKTKVFGADAYAALMGVTPVAGYELPVNDEAVTIPTTPFEVTVAGGVNFKRNVGVIDLDTGLGMTRGATSTGTGIYSLNESTGKYTFNTADTGHKLLISYTKGDSVNGKTVPVGAQLAGTGNIFSLDLWRTYSSGTWGMRFYAARGGGFDVALGGQKYAEIDLEFRAYKDPTTNKLCDAFFTK